MTLVACRLCQPRLNVVKKRNYKLTLNPAMAMEHFVAFSRVSIVILSFTCKMYNAVQCLESLRCQSCHKPVVSLSFCIEMPVHKLKKYSSQNSSHPGVRNIFCRCVFEVLSLSRSFCFHSIVENPVS